MPPKPQHNVHGVDSNVCIQIDYDKCIGCQACARACGDTQNIYAFGIGTVKQPPLVNARNGDNSMNTETTRVKLDMTDCIGCGQCLHACSTGALVPTNRTSEIFEAKAAGKKLVAVLSPSVRIGIAEAMGMPIGVTGEAQLISNLRKIGFDYVFDNQWGADSTTTEDGKEILAFRAEGRGTCFTSCCPAWINLVETKYPELIPNISTARSPHGIICSMIRKHWVPEMKFKQEDVIVVGFMPCTAKKAEAAREVLRTDGIPDCNISVTTRETAELFKSKGITFSQEEEDRLKGTQEGMCDEPFRQVSGSAYIFGKTAGVSEAVARYIYSINGVQFDPKELKVEVVWEYKDKIQNIKVITFTCKDNTYRVGVAHGGQAVAQLVKTYKEMNLDAVEMMMCPLGCQNGGGQPRQMNKAMIPKRAEALDKHDRECSFGDCYSNKQMNEYISSRVTDKHAVHATLHTSFADRTH